MTVINTNVKSLIAQQALTTNNRSLSKSMEQLSTGKRINSAADDAAGLAISNKMTAQIRALNQSVRNANDAISMIQTAEGATKEMSNMLQRMRELAVQANNGTYSSNDKTALNNEYSQLASEIARIAKTTTWNGMEVTGSAAGSYSFQIGSDSTASVSLTFEKIASAGDAVALASAEVLTGTGAASAISLVDNAISQIDTYRSKLGAMINRLQYASDNLTNVSTNMSASRSRILDTDYANATTELARTQIISQAATAMLAQANQAPSSVLTLLR